MHHNTVLHCKVFNDALMPTAPYADGGIGQPAGNMRMLFRAACPCPSDLVILRGVWKPFQTSPPQDVEALKVLASFTVTVGWPCFWNSWNFHIAYKVSEARMTYKTFPVDSHSKMLAATKLRKLRALPILCPPGNVHMHQTTRHVRLGPLK